MKINKHFHTKYGKNTSTQDCLHICARVHAHIHTHTHTHTQRRSHTHTVPIKSAYAAANTHNTHMAEKDGGVGGGGERLI